MISTGDESLNQRSGTEIRPVFFLEQQQIELGNVGNYDLAKLSGRCDSIKMESEGILL